MNRKLHLTWLILILSGCLSPSPPPPSAKAPLVGEDEAAVAPRAPRDAPSAKWLTEADKAAAAGDVKSARQLLQQLAGQPLADAERLQVVLIEARLQLAEGSPKEAVELLRRYAGSRSLSSDDHVSLQRLLAAAYRELGMFMASGLLLMEIAELVPRADRQEMHDQIWRSLSAVPMETLHRIAAESTEEATSGWLSLASLMRTYADSPSRQLTELSMWRSTWANHPASQLLPTSLQLLPQVLAARSIDLAVLLPLSGPNRTLGRAIRDGILAAFYSSDGSLDAGRPRIQFHDTSGKDIGTLADQVIAAGADFILGPLDRDLVTQLHQRSNPQVPLLALNRSPRTTPGAATTNFFQFALSPEDEVSLVSERAWQDGHRRVILLAPDDDWGRRNGGLFENIWKARGGTIITAQYFNTLRDYSDLVRSVLRLDSSNQRALALNRITGRKLEFTPRRRQDLDAIVLLANPAQAKAINPSLAFHYAEDIPVYSTSHVYDNADSKLAMMDLNGIRFCDMPFKLLGETAMEAEVRERWPAAVGALAPFYALGMDAYNIFPRIGQLRLSPGERYYGTTGVLSMNPEGTIRRGLNWAFIKDGRVQILPTVAEARP